MKVLVFDSSTRTIIYDSPSLHVWLEMDGFYRIIAPFVALE